MTVHQAYADHMTPAAMILLLELYYAGGETPLDSPARRQAGEDFDHLGLISPESLVRRGRGWRVVPGALTERGNTHVLALLSLPLPVARTVWETPKKAEG